MDNSRSSIDNKHNRPTKENNMTLQQFINSYRIATGGPYDFRLAEAQLFMEDAREALSTPLSYIRSNASALYDVSISDL